MPVISKFLTCNEHFTVMSVMWCRCATTEACPGFFFMNVFLASIAGYEEPRTCWEHYLSGVWDKNSGVIISSVRGHISADMLTWLRIKKINVLHVGMNKSHAILFVLHFDKLYLACGRQYSFPISFVIFLYIQGSFLLSIAATILHKDYFNLSNSDN